MGYLGTGENAKAGDFSEMLRNFVLATYFRQDSGVYSLGGLDGIDLSSIEIPKACTATQTPQKLPGGYSACLTKINCTGTIVVNEEADGADIRHAGIKITYDGVKGKVTKNADGSRTFTLTTTDKNAKIYYTVNGDLPDTDNGILYSGPFTLPKDMYGACLRIRFLKISAPHCSSFRDRQHRNGWMLSFQKSAVFPERRAWSFAARKKSSSTDGSARTIPVF